MADDNDQKPSPALLVIKQLVERFKYNEDTYTTSTYNETQVRREFIDPFFKALGWDIDNEQGLAEAYKDVIHEDAIKVGGATKAPDYCFRIGGSRKFFVEAKRPATGIQNDPGPAYQLRRYAWSNKLPVSIVTDFEEFAVYDTRIRPKPNDKASVGRILYLTYREYEEKWSELTSVFSKTAILKGSFDKYAESSRRKRGTTQVDDEFLKEISKWRISIARNLALRNSRLSERDLNFAVDRTIDRVVFLRMCEDRGIERYGTLLATSKGSEVYRKLGELFRNADDRYNAGIFYFRPENNRGPPDDLTLSLSLDDRILKEILTGLYYPESPYEFSVLPPAILGQVYEQFLGQEITLTAGHRARLENKPHVRKAGGVFYTPTFVVDYILSQTLEEILKTALPPDVGPEREPTKGRKRGSTSTLPRVLRILDPACGSGSFLLAAYQKLLDWHRDTYVALGPQKVKDRLYQGAGGKWLLSIKEKKRILLNNIYGVDIDEQAVEVTKLSLLLKVLENETAETVGTTLRLFHERALPDLGANIKCGNSLIGPDYFNRGQLSMFDSEEHLRVNAFGWAKEFPFLEQGLGFDAVVGNPPWGADIDRDLSYFHTRYPATTQEHTDSFKLFVEAGLEKLSDGGRFSMIVPSGMMRQRRLKDVRHLLLRFTIASVVNLGDHVFRGVVAPSCIVTIVKAPSKSGHTVRLRELQSLAAAEREAALEGRVSAQSDMHVSQEEMASNEECELKPLARKLNVNVLRLKDFPALKLKDAGINYQRVKVGMQQKGNSDLAERLLYEGARKRKMDKMYWKGSDIDRFWVATTTQRFCRLDVSLRKNEVVRLNQGLYDTVPKILIRQTSDSLISAVDNVGLWFGRSVIAVLILDQRYRAEYFVGLLNSKLLNAEYQSLVREERRAFAQVKLSKLGQLPMRWIDFDNSEEKAKHDKLVSLVERITSLVAQERNSSSERHKAEIVRQEETVEGAIDLLVSELYAS